MASEQSIGSAAAICLAGKRVLVVEDTWVVAHALADRGAASVAQRVSRPPSLLRCKILKGPSPREVASMMFRQSVTLGRLEVSGWSLSPLAGFQFLLAAALMRACSASKPASERQREDQGPRQRDHDGVGREFAAR